MLELRQRWALMPQQSEPLSYKVQAVEHLNVSQEDLLQGELSQESRKRLGMCGGLIGATCRLTLAPADSF